MPDSSDWGYSSIEVEDLSSGTSSWGYESISLIDFGKPNMIHNGTESDVNWYVMKSGTSKPVVRWKVVKNGVATLLDNSHAIEWTPPSFIAGADPVGSAQYPVPGNNVIFIATTGSDSDNGTSISTPKKTLSSAITAVPAGGTIVVRGGIYHEGEIFTSKSFSIQSYPGEEVWFDGSSIFSETWTGSSPWIANYNIVFDRLMGKTSGQLAVWTGAAERFVTDQVWLDDTKLLPAPDNTASPGAGKFSVNQSTHKLTIGSSPSGKTVRVVDLTYFIHANAPVTIRGIGVRRYAQAMIEFRNGAIRVEDGSTIEQVTIQDCSVSALTLYGSDIIIRSCTFQDVGQSGVHGDYLNNSVFEQNIIRRCNRNGYDAEPTTAGIKIGRTWYGCKIRHNYIRDVVGAYGIWTDTAVSQTAIYGNTIIGTSALGAGNYRMKNGIEVEASDGMYIGGVQHYNYVVGNRISDCRQAGLLVFDSGHVRVWNNQLSAAVALYLWQD